MNSLSNIYLLSSLGNLTFTLSFSLFAPAKETQTNQASNEPTKNPLKNRQKKKNQKTTLKF